MGLLTLSATTISNPVQGMQIDASAYVDQIKTLLQGVFTMDNLVAIIAGSLALGAGFVIFHFAYRFIKGKVMKAVTKGKA